MARPLRKCFPNVTYHITTKCRNRLTLMQKNIFKDTMNEIIELTLKKYKFELSGFTIMDNHLHLIIKTLENEAPISKIIQYIKSRFAEKYNRETDTTGPFWDGRFSDEIIEETEDPLKYLLILLWYLAFNPVKAGYTEDIIKYKYSTIKFYLYKNYKSKVKITLHSYFLSLGNNFNECVKRFYEYCPYGVRPPN